MHQEVITCETYNNKLSSMRRKYYSHLCNLERLFQNKNELDKVEQVKRVISLVETPLSPESDHTKFFKVLKTVEIQIDLWTDQEILEEYYSVGMPVEPQTPAITRYYMFYYNFLKQTGTI
mmetsp:Transcript_128326/g.191252  ORF Transcript_128326/g.191252 Transcript_128326/m.191252 type:complete len:120 (+) Transcript_128326:5-364(+)